MTSRRFPRPSAGFSLIEVLVTLALGSVAAAAVLSFSQSQMVAMRDQTRQVDLQTTARSIVEVFAREVRRAGMDPLCVKTFAGIDTAAQQELKILSDLSGNGVIDQSNENVTYRIDLTNKVIYRIANDVPSTLLAGAQLTGSRFRYYDANGTERVPSPALDGATRAAIRRVRLELQVSKPGQSGGQTLKAAASTDVDLRNRFFVASTGCP
jgi:prepilin-type N-terminal cleavage/methylation domain-containing protein